MFDRDNNRNTKILWVMTITRNYFIINYAKMNSVIIWMLLAIGVILFWVYAVAPLSEIMNERNKQYSEYDLYINK